MPGHKADAILVDLQTCARPTAIQYSTVIYRVDYFCQDLNNTKTY